MGKYDLRAAKDQAATYKMEKKHTVFNHAKDVNICPDDFDRGSLAVSRYLILTKFVFCSAFECCIVMFIIKRGYSLFLINFLNNWIVHFFLIRLTVLDIKTELVLISSTVSTTLKC